MCLWDFFLIHAYDVLNMGFQLLGIFLYFFDPSFFEISQLHQWNDVALGGSWQFLSKENLKKALFQIKAMNSQGPTKKMRNQKKEKKKSIDRSWKDSYANII